MIIKCLVENTSCNESLQPKHGLSLYIETDNHKILFDVGPDDLFIKNAYKLGVDISEVDTVIISHGHLDHGGGLQSFLDNNKKAKVFIQEQAFNKYYAKFMFLKFNIGLDAKIINDRFVFTKDELIIDKSLRVFSNVREKKLLSKSNNALYKKIGNKYFKDDFIHEQNLIIQEKDNYYLFAGCAHSGIVNIITKGESLINNQFNYLISGFHLFNPINKKSEDEKLVKSIGEFLKQKNTKYFTMHCTGLKAFNLLEKVLDDKIEYLKTGMTLEL